MKYGKILSKVALFGLIVVVFSYLSYYFWFRVQTENFLAARPTSPWFAELLQLLYPRLVVEMQRTQAHFFLEKADQLALRLHLFAGALCLLARFFLRKKNRYAKQAAHFFDAHIDTKILPYTVRFFYLGIFLFTKDWFCFLSDFLPLRGLYKPILLYKILQIPYPSATSLYLLWFVYVLSLTAVICWIKPYYASVVASVLFFVLQGFLQSFEKIDHGLAVAGYALLLLPLLVRLNLGAERKNRTHQPAYPLILLKLSVGIAYFQSGLEKVLNSGIDWLFAADKFLQTTHGFSAQKYLPDYLPDFPFLPAMVLYFQLTFLFFSWKNTWQWVYLAFGVLFHAATAYFLGVGGLLNAWILTYIFWLVPTTYSRSEGLM